MSHESEFFILNRTFITFGEFLYFSTFYIYSVYTRESCYIGMVSYDPSVLRVTPIFINSDFYNSSYCDILGLKKKNVFS